MHKRNLLVLAALFAVAPLSAQELPAVAEHESECPYAQAALDAADNPQTAVESETGAPASSLLGASRSSAFLP